MGKFKQKDFISIADLSRQEIQMILNLARFLKARAKKGDTPKVLKGKSLAMLFEKPSNRTRVSFEVGMWQLGGLAINLDMKNLRFGTGETIHDTGCSLKAFRRDALANVKLFNGMHRFLPTLVRMEGGTVTQVKVNHRPRRFGRSKYSIFNRFLRPAMDLLAVMWMKRRHLKYRIRKEG